MREGVGQQEVEEQEERGSTAGVRESTQSETGRGVKRGADKTPTTDTSNLSRVPTSLSRHLWTLHERGAATYGLRWEGAPGYVEGIEAPGVAVVGVATRIGVARPGYVDPFSASTFVGCMLSIAFLPCRGREPVLDFRRQYEVGSVLASLCV